MNGDNVNTQFFQDDFDQTIGRLDRVLSKLVGWGRLSKQRNELNSKRESRLTQAMLQMDEANQQTLKHHAEDMLAAGKKILADLGVAVEATPQPTTRPSPLPMHCDISLDWCDYTCPCGDSICTRSTADSIVNSWLAEHKPHTNGKVLQHTNENGQRATGPVADVLREM